MVVTIDPSDVLKDLIPLRALEVLTRKDVRDALRALVRTADDTVGMSPEYKRRYVAQKLEEYLAQELQERVSRSILNWLVESGVLSVRKEQGRMQ